MKCDGSQADTSLLQELAARTGASMVGESVGREVLLVHIWISYSLAERELVEVDKFAGIKKDMAEIDQFFDINLIGFTGERSANELYGLG